MTPVHPVAAPPLPTAPESKGCLIFLWLVRERVEMGADTREEEKRDVVAVDVEEEYNEGKREEEEEEEEERLFGLGFRVDGG
jgi:hypothetical protein